MSNLHVDILQEYVDGELAGRERLRLAQHLGRNAHDRALVEAYQTQNEALHREFHKKLHEPVPRHIRRLLADASGHAAAGDGPAPQEVDAQAVSDDGEDAAPKQGLLGALVRQAVQAYEFYAGEDERSPVFEPERMAEFFRWFEQRLQVKVFLPRFDGLGFSLLQARLLPLAKGTAGQVLYQDGSGRRLAVYFQVLDDAGEGGEAIVPACIQQERLTIYYWQGDGIHYALVAAINPGELSQLVRTAVF